MDDDQILMMGGDENDIAEYAKNNGADLTEEDIRETVKRFDLFLQDLVTKMPEIKVSANYSFWKHPILWIRERKARKLMEKIIKYQLSLPAKYEFEIKTPLSYERKRHSKHLQS